MKKTFLLFSIFAIIFIQNVSSQQLGDLYTERNAGFTMSMPLGWQTLDFNQKYLMIIGPEDAGVNPNIGFGDEDYTGSISDYIDAAWGMFSMFYTELSLISRSSFKTNAGANGELITYLGTLGSVRVRQRMYVFPNARGTAVMVITGTAPVTGGEKYDAIFDASVKTFNWAR